MVLVAPSRPDASTRSNAILLAQFVARRRIHLLPRLTNPLAGGDAQVEVAVSTKAKRQTQLRQLNKLLAQITVRPGSS